MAQFNILPVSRLINYMLFVVLHCWINTGSYWSPKPLHWAGSPDYLSEHCDVGGVCSEVRVQEGLRGQVEFGRYCKPARSFNHSPNKHF